MQELRSTALGSVPYIQCRTSLDTARTQAAPTIVATPAPSGPMMCTTFGHTTNCSEPELATATESSARPKWTMPTYPLTDKIPRGGV
jgi:hypothetical protein